jgi:hypothetical protein
MPLTLPLAPFPEIVPPLLLLMISVPVPFSVIPATPPLTEVPVARLTVLPSSVVGPGDRSGLHVDYIVAFRTGSVAVGIVLIVDDVHTCTCSSARPLTFRNVIALLCDPLRNVSRRVASSARCAGVARKRKRMSVVIVPRKRLQARPSRLSRKNYVGEHRNKIARCVFTVRVDGMLSAQVHGADAGLTQKTRKSPGKNTP